VDVEITIYFSPSHSAHANVLQGTWMLLLVAFFCCAWAQSAGPAVAVYGQMGLFTYSQMNNPNPTFNVNVPFSTATGLNFPTCARADVDGSLYVCDTKDGRIVKFAAGQSITAVDVWGAPNLTASRAPIQPPTASSLYGPHDLAFYGGVMFVADLGNNRVVSFPPGQKVASQVWGQSGCFTCNGDSLLTDLCGTL
jgi:hypothetical protein